MPYASVQAIEHDEQSKRYPSSVTVLRIESLLPSNHGVLLSKHRSRFLLPVLEPIMQISGRVVSVRELGFLIYWEIKVFDEIFELRSQ